LKRPAKPRIQKPRLTWKWSPSKEAWEPYHRVSWIEGRKRKQKAVLLKWGGRAEELDRLYWACEAGRHEKQKVTSDYTWAKLIIAWREDPRIQMKLADSTKKTYRRDMDRIMLKNGDKDVRSTTRQAVRAAHDMLSPTPRKADKILATLSLLWNYGRNKLDWPIGENPAEGIEHFGPQREYEPWPEWMIGKLDTAPQNVQTLATVILNTGQRPGAAVEMRFDHFNSEWMKVLDEKRGEYFEVFCPEALQAFVQNMPRAGKYLLAKNLTEPVGYDAVEKDFRKWRNGMGEEAKPFALDGLRKLAIVRLAESGWSDAEIQAATNQSPEMVAYYRKKASRKILTKSAAKRSE